MKDHDFNSSLLIAAALPESWDTCFPCFKRQMPHRVPPPDPPPARGTGNRLPDFFDWGPIQKPTESMPGHQVIDDESVHACRILNRKAICAPS